MTARGPLRRKFEAAYRAGEKHPRDAGTVELARQYADQLDAAADLHRIAADLVEGWDREDPMGKAHVSKLANALSARQALADLGPKYLATLAALNLTSAARTAAAGKDGAGGEPADPQEAALLAGREASRRRRAAAVDAAASPPDA